MEYQKITKVSKKIHNKIIQRQLQMANKIYLSPEESQKIIDNLR